MSLSDHLEGRGRRRPAKGQSLTKNIVFVSACILLLLVFGIGLYIKSESIRVPTDPVSLCPTEAAPTALLVFLLDMSDGFSEAQLLQIRNEIMRRRAVLPRFGLIEAYAVDRIGQRVTKPVFHLCNPGGSKDVNKIYQNPDMAQKKWDSFDAQLSTELERLILADGSSTSPIFEAVQSAALRTLTAPQYDDVPKQLLIVSDLLQNMPGKINQYRGSTSFKEFKKSAYFSDVRTDLSGVDVSVLYLVRPGTPQGADHISFWEQYFSSQGAVLSGITPIYGAR